MKQEHKSASVAVAAGGMAVIVAFAACIGGSLWLEGQLAGDVLQPPVVVPPQVWAHRGFHHAAAVKANSLAAFATAVDAGCAGIELDVQWSNAGELLVGHPGGQSASSVALPLTAVFAQFGSALTYWIDFKHLESDAIGRIAVALRAAMDAAPDAGSASWRVFVESRNLPALAALRTQVPTVVPVAHIEPLQRWRFSPWYLHALSEIDRWQIRSVALHHRDYSGFLADGLRRLRVLLYTVNDVSEYRRLSPLGVYAVTTDNIEVLNASAVVGDS